MVLFTTLVFLSCFFVCYFADTLDELQLVELHVFYMMWVVAVVGTGSNGIYTWYCRSCGGTDLYRQAWLYARRVFML